MIASTDYLRLSTTSKGTDRCLLYPFDVGTGYESLPVRDVVIVLEMEVVLGWR